VPSPDYNEHIEADVGVYVPRWALHPRGFAVEFAAYSNEREGIVRYVRSDRPDLTRLWVSLDTWQNWNAAGVASVSP